MTDTPKTSAQAAAEQLMRSTRRGRIFRPGVARWRILMCADKRGRAMTTTDNSPDVTGAHNTGAPNSAGPILDAFDAIAAKGGDPKEIAGKQFQFIMEQIRGNALPFFTELRDNRPILQSPMATLVAQFRDVEEILHRELVFSVSPYLPRMMGVIGPFVLSQDHLVARINSQAQSTPRSDIYGRRTYSGRPSSSIRFSEATAMATSVVCRPSVRERSASPITRL
jgi:hypothetical protein